MRRFLDICYILFPIVGLFIAIGCWIIGKSERADKVLFLSFAGIWVNILILLPAALILRAAFL